MHYPAHGANAHSLYVGLGVEMPEKVLDLSENVNALGYPDSINKVWPLLHTSLAHYPDEQAEPFRSQVARMHQVKTEHVVVGNGAAECLMVIAQQYRGKKAILIEPSFSEYKRTLEQANVNVESIIVTQIDCYELPMEKIKQAMIDANVLYLCNPNNPTGVLTNQEVIEQLCRYGVQVGCDVVIDEAFMDWTNEQQSVIPLINTYKNLIVLRSMTKMYALAGVRLGYMLSQQAQQFEQLFPHWHVSNIAIALGSICLEEQSFVLNSRKYSDESREQLQHFLRGYGCTVSQSVANFLLFRLPSRYDTDDFFMFLLTRGIVLRHTKNYVGLDGQWLRIGMKQQSALEVFKEGFIAYAESH